MSLREYFNGVSENIVTEAIGIRVVESRSVGENETVAGEYFAFFDDKNIINIYQRTAAGQGEGGGNSIIRNKFSTAESVAELVAKKADSALMKAGVGAVPRTLEQVLLDNAATPEDYGAKANGIDDDAPAFQRALNANNTVNCVPGKNYRFASPVDIKRSNQRLNLMGSTVTAAGDFSIFNAFGGVENVHVGNGVIEASAMTGGFVLRVNGADRVLFHDLIALNPHNLAWIGLSNVCELRNVWANNVRSTYGIVYDGDVGRCDILRLFGVNISMPNSPDGIGILWRGDAHTLQIQSVTIVKPHVGLQTIAGNGSEVPSFGMFDDLEIDFPDSNGVDFVDGKVMTFTPSFYCHGSKNGSGVRIGANIPANSVTFTGGKITGHSRYGINNAVPFNLSNLMMSGNGIDNIAIPDVASLNAPRFKILSDFFLGITGTNRVVGLAPGFAIGHDPILGAVYADVGGQTHLRLRANSAELWIDGKLRTVTLGAADATGKRPLLASG